MGVCPHFALWQICKLSLFYNICDVDGYYRDKCVFSDEIDIEDSVSVNVQYSGGVVMRVCP